MTDDDYDPVEACRPHSSNTVACDCGFKIEIVCTDWHTLKGIICPECGVGVGT
jgi:hypothetical protein